MRGSRLAAKAKVKIVTPWSNLHPQVQAILTAGAEHVILAAWAKIM
jgi:hypothetical protein